MQPGAGLPLHRPLPDDHARRPQRDAARRPPRQHRPDDAPGGLRPDAARLYRPGASTRARRQATTPGSRPTRACCPGFTPRLRLPENNGPWLSWLAARGHEIPAGSLGDLPAGRRALRAAHDVARPLWRGRDRDGLHHRRGAALARRADRGPALVRACLLPEAASALCRAGALQHDARSGRPPALRPRRRRHDGMGRCIPSSPIGTRSRGGRQPFRRSGRARRPSATGATRISAPSGPIYWGMIAEVDRQIGRLVAGAQGRRGRMTTRSSS